MKIGILSDTHNQVENLQKALSIFAEWGIEILIHCGDVSTSETAVHLKGFRVHYVYGNTDSSQMQIGTILRTLNSENTAGITFVGEIDGIMLAATHGHLMMEFEELVADGRYQYVFHGHTHRRRDEMIGQTRVINPGALGGTQYEPRSVCVLDLSSGDAEFIEVA